MFHKKWKLKGKQINGGLALTMDIENRLIYPWKQLTRIAQIFSLDWTEDKSFPSQWENKSSKIKQPSSQRKTPNGWRDLFAMVVLPPHSSTAGEAISLRLSYFELEFRE